MQKDFLDLYRAVITTEGQIKDVGRDECIKLISAAYEVGYPSGDYGSLETGKINIENVRYLRRSILTFLCLYSEVFEEDGTIKVCGREKCKSLIYYALCIRPYENFGNPETGWMNPANIIALYKELRNVQEQTS